MDSRKSQKAISSSDSVRTGATGGGDAGVVTITTGGGGGGAEVVMTTGGGGGGGAAVDGAGGAAVGNKMLTCWFSLASGKRGASVVGGTGRAVTGGR